MPKQIGWGVTRQNESPARFIPWATGRFYQTTFATSVGATGANATLLYASPIYVPNPEGVVVTSIGIQVTSGGTASNARFGIYSADNLGRPFALLLDSGLVATTSTGFQSASVSYPLRQGWYYLVDAYSGTVNPSVASLGASLSTFQLGFPNALSANTAVGMYRAVGDSNIITYMVRDGLPGHYPQWDDIDPFAGATSRVMVGI